MRRRTLTADDQANLQEKVFQGATARQFAGFAREALLGQHESSIRKRMFAAIDSDEPLDPMKAAQAWIELRAIHKLIAKLETMAKGGITAQQHLEDGTPQSE